MVFGTGGYRGKSGNRPFVRVLSDEKGSCFFCKNLTALRVAVFLPKVIKELCRRKIGRTVRLNTLLAIPPLKSVQYNRINRWMLITQN